MLLGIVIVGNSPGKIDIWRIRRLKYGYVKFFLWDGKPFRRSQQFPGIGDGIFFEVVAEGEIAEHFEEGVVAVGEADVFEVVVLAAGADAFLAGGGAAVVALLEAEEDVFELVHPGIGEEQRGIVHRDERGTPDSSMVFLFEEAEEHFADFVSGHDALRGFLWQSKRLWQRHKAPAMTPWELSGRNSKHETRNSGHPHHFFESV